MRTALALALLFTPAACSSSTGQNAPLADGGMDAFAPPLDAGGDDVGATDAAQDSPADAGFVEAPHDRLPQIPANGGPVIAAPKIVTVTFTGYDQDATMKAFGDWVVSSSWLTAVGHDYGVGAGVHTAHVVLPAPPSTVSDLDVQSLLEQKLGDGTLPSAEGPDAGSVDAGPGVPGGYLYVFFYPSSTTTGSFLGGPTTCVDVGGGHFLGGYHWETQSGAYHVPYAVVPECKGAGGVEGPGDLEVAASHEIMEASSDPFPYSETAYAIIDPNDPWVATAGEVGDLCEGQVTQEAGFSAQRIWSNSAAAADAPPCVPTPPGGFYNVSPSPQGTQIVAAGSSVTFTLTGFSTQPAAPWSLDALSFGQASFQPTAVLSTHSIANGATATLTVTVPAGTASQSYAAVFLSSYRAVDDYNVWPVAVVVK